MNLEQMLADQRTDYRNTRLEILQLEETLQGKKDIALRQEGAIELLMYQIKEQKKKEQEGE